LSLTEGQAVCAVVRDLDTGTLGLGELNRIISGENGREWHEMLRRILKQAESDG